MGNCNVLYILLNLTIILYNTFLFKQPKIQLAGNFARPCGVFLFHGILGGWGQDKLPTRRQFQLISATQCTLKWPPGLELSFSVYVRH
jgi:hypothetical protein